MRWCICTISKGRSLKSCVALVVFCCSLLLACISSVWAATDPVDYDSAHGITIFAAPPTFDPIRQGKSFSLPLFDIFGIYSYTDVDFTGHGFGVTWKSLEFQPFDHDVSLVLSYSVIAGKGGHVTGTSYYQNYYCNVTDSYFRRDNSGNIIQSTVKGTILNGGVLDTPTTAFAPYCTASYVLPAGTNGVSANRYYWNDLVITGTALLCCTCAYIVDSADDAVVSAVNDILTQVKAIKANTDTISSDLASCLSVLNSILAQCKALNADTDTIITILNAVKSELVTLNGKVDNIYTLLKDSLKAESAAVDKKAQETGEQIMQRVDSEQYWSDKNTETFNALDIGNFSFGDGVVGTLPTVSNLFKGLWDSFGDAVLMFTFPLMLGLALVIIGRISRHSGKGGKGGGDSD